MFLMMRQAFELGYRRYEWKCDSLNAPSRAAAQRLGLSFEGIFRQALVYKEPQPRLGVVRGDRHRVAGARSRVRTLALAGQLRRRRPPEGATLRAHRAGARQPRVKNAANVQLRSHEVQSSTSKYRVLRASCSGALTLTRTLSLEL